MTMRTLLLGIGLLSLTAGAASLDDLHAAIAKECPISGLSGSRSDPKRIRIDFSPGATDAQRRRAFQIRDSFDFEASGVADLDEQLVRLRKQAAQSSDLSDSDFSNVSIKIERALLIEDPAEKKKRVQEIEQWMNRSVKASLGR